MVGYGLTIHSSRRRFAARLNSGVRPQEQALLMTTQKPLLLTQDQAYLAMYYFLDKHFTLGCEELGGILGSMSLLADGSPADQALCADWQEAVAAALAGNVDAQLSLG